MYRMLAMNGMSDVPTTKRAPRRLNSINDMTSADFIQEVSSVKVPDVGEVQVKVVKGDFSAVPVYCQQFIARYVSSRYVYRSSTGGRRKKSGSATVASDFATF